MKHLYLTTAGTPDTLALCDDDGKIIHGQFRTVIDSKCGDLCEAHISFWYDPKGVHGGDHFLRPYEKRREVKP